ncbi:LIM/homeobox protein Lhx1-like [Chrysoperla carnea]|uniref:LIM/homeobox protein Lhx1-like n=1 Tax=Chrysoperla carnea TaxID=189513 RepID=UPI001D061E11|nr:LIM/homeobox protein Lhx1-like [Chrysoperla carnea]
MISSNQIYSYQKQQSLIASESKQKMTMDVTKTDLTNKSNMASSGLLPNVGPNVQQNGPNNNGVPSQNSNTPGGVSTGHHHSSGASQNNNNGQQECAGCGKPITERFLLRALDLFWHEDCLKCGCCDCRLGEVGSTLYTKANLILCKRDYLRLFGNTGYCAACNKVIPAFEMVMRARNNVYHLECFACQQCNHRFCVGDRFYLCENKILCEYDYEERLVFANMAYNPSSLAHIKRQTNNLPPPPPSNLHPAMNGAGLRTCTELPDRRAQQHHSNEVNGFHGPNNSSDSFDNTGK